MIFPSKHLRIEKSLLNLGSIVLKELKNYELTLDMMWAKIKTNVVNEKYIFSDLVLVCDFLYCIGAIDINEVGIICLN